MTKTPTDVLLNNFASELVVVVTNAKISQEAGDQIVETNLSIEGTLIDADDSFIYLGSDIGDIFSAVNKNSVVCIELKQEAQHEHIDRRDLN